MITRIEASMFFFYFLFLLCWTVAGTSFLGFMGRHLSDEGTYLMKACLGAGR